MPEGIQKQLIHLAQLETRIREVHDAHMGGFGGNDAGHSVLNNNAILGADPHRFGCQQEGFRVGLANLDQISSDYGVRLQAVFLNQGLDRVQAAARGDGA